MIALRPAVPRWRREPYRVMFPLGLALSWAGVLHWLLHAVGALDAYRSVFHAVVQVQGFVTAFAVGFLFTFVHRRSGTAPPSSWEMGLAVAAPVVSTAAAWAEWWLLAEAAWFVLVAAVLVHALRRLVAPPARGRFPPSFVWVPAGLAAGGAGAVLVALSQREGAASWLLDLGRGLLAQGMVTGLVLGVGGVLVPQLTRGEAPALSPPGPSMEPRAARLRWAHGAAAAAFGASFALEIGGHPRLAYGVRAAIAGVVLAGPHGALRRPSVAGLHRWLVWIAAWLVPAGYALVAAAPHLHRAGLHVVFIGGYALIALAVSLHVVVSHGGHLALLARSPWQVVTLALLIGLALVARVLVEADAARFTLWLGLASAAFLGATLAWGALVVPALQGPA